MRNALFAAALAAFVSLSAAAAARAQAVPAAPSVALVNNRQLILRRRTPDGSLGAPAPYVIKGVDWSPASRGTNTTTNDPNNANVRRPEFAAWAATDIPLLKAMNVNTVRLFIDPGADAAGRAVMDALYNNGIMVIMTVDDAVNNTARAQQVVSFYKDHPAVLMWSLGSEWNINRYFGAASTLFDAAQRTETAAAIIKSLDTNHPVATSYGDIGDAETPNFVNNVCRSVDVWGLNIYRGNSFGTLFSDWKAMTGKPMYVGEFGTDAFRSPPGGALSNGVVDELMQAQWDSILWNELAKNLSAVDPTKTALGGTVFVSNDEWWKVSPAGSQQPNGFGLADGHPDGFANEEFFGLYDIDRHTRRAYDSFKTLYAPGAQPARTALFRAASRGFTAREFNLQVGVAYLFDRGRIVYRREGGGGGGRGFNILAVSPSTGRVIGQPQTFDTWGSRDTGLAHAALISYLDGLPAGTLVLLAVGDDAGLNQFSSCTPLNFTWTENLYRALEALGAHSVRQYCYQDSWAMAAFKGQGQAVEESLSHNNVEANASAAVALTSSVQFAAASLSAGEGAGSIQITVTRAGDLSDGSEVAYRTADQTADERSDYDAARGTLRFAPGEQTKTVSVALVNDVFVEPAEAFSVVLESPSGASLGAPSAATVTINSDDATQPTAADNPVSNSQFFVRQNYVDFLNREPDAAGLNFWTNEIESCGANQQCREVKRINVSAAFFLSIEFQQTGYLVYRLHQLAFNTGEALRLAKFLPDTQEIGRGVIVNQGEWQQQLEANKQEFADRFVARAEFKAAFDPLGDAQYVDALNSRTTDPAQPSSGNALTQGERDQLVADLVAGRKTRAQVLRSVAENAEFRRRQSNKAFVLMQYFGYLRRDPDTAGFNFWLSKLDQFNGDFIRAEMVKAFISSIEYRQRFGPA